MPGAEQPGVDELVQGRLGELRGHLAAQVVQDQQVAVEIAPRLVPGLRLDVRLPLEFAQLKLREDVHGGVIDHREAPLGDGAGNTGG